ncbi:hypothetical protein GCM10027037_25930 [Mucilaginibacter koreensis]
MPKIIVLSEAPDNRKLYFNADHILYFYEVADFDGNTTKVFTGDSNFDVTETAEEIKHLLNE